MKPLPLFLAVMAFGVVAGTAQAQIGWYRGPGVVTPYGYGINYGYGVPYGVGLNYYGGGYSPVEGYQRGLADVIRSRGQAAENYSRARINNEEARRKYIENKLRWTEIYWQRKRLGEAELAKDHAEDRERRQRWIEANRDRQLETLPPSQFDAETGGIEWPEALQADIYAEYRAQIEEELERQATSGSTSNSPKIRSLARQMQSVLKEQIRSMPANDYIAARKFLDRLVNQMALAETT